MKSMGKKRIEGSGWSITQVASANQNATNNTLRKKSKDWESRLSLKLKHSYITKDLSLIHI